MSFDALFAILAAFFIVTVSPGPANVAVATIAMSQGRASGMRFGLGLTVGLAFWGVVAATGLGVILQASEIALFGLKLFGGCYLLSLAYHSTRSALKPTPLPSNHELGGRWFYRGLLLNISNPKAVVAWMAALSMGLGTGENVAQLAFATVICMALGLVNYAGHAVVFSYPQIMAAYQRLRRWIDGVVGGLFGIAGLGLIKSALAR